MKKRKLKKFVVPTIYVLIIITAFLSVSVINNIMLKDMTNYDYSKSLMKEVTEAVLSDGLPEEFIKPVISDNAVIKTDYYRRSDDASSQQKSLLYFQNTYIPSTGVMYEGEESFDVVCVYDGIVEEINNDLVLGDYIVIKHNDNLRTYYYSLKDIGFNVGDEISQGTILGQAVGNEFNDKNSVLFEVYYQDKALDPINFYTQNPKEYQ